MGVTNPNTQLLLNIIYAIGGWIPAIIGARLHDVVGRRKMLMGATAGMAVCLAIAAGTAANFVQSGSQQSSVASITFIYIFGSVFALGFTSMQPIYPGEVLSNDMRAKGMGVFQLTSGCAGFVNTFAAPVALNKVRNISAQFPIAICGVDMQCRSATGSTSSSCSGIFSNSLSSTSSMLRRSPGPWKTWMPSSKLPIRGKRARRHLRQHPLMWLRRDLCRALAKSVNQSGVSKAIAAHLSAYHSASFHLWLPVRAQGYIVASCDPPSKCEMSRLYTAIQSKVLMQSACLCCDPFLCGQLLGSCGKQ